MNHDERKLRVTQGEVFDVAVDVVWPMQAQPQLAAKDAAGKPLAEAEAFA